jgi:hypothetical protein
LQIAMHLHLFYLQFFLVAIVSILSQAFCPWENAMEPVLSNEDFRVSGFVLLVAAVFISAAILDSRRMKQLPSPNRLSSNFDAIEFGDDNPRRSTFAESEELYAEMRLQLRANKSGGSPLLTDEWD